MQNEMPTLRRSLNPHALARPGRGFTLIEVLVVVAILALLVAILLPSLTRAKELSRRVVCESNMMQLHRGNMFYLTDWKGVFMPHRYSVNLARGERGDSLNEKHWFHLLERYTKSREVPHCPTLGQNTQFDKSDAGRTSWEWGYNRRDIGIGYNAWFLGLWNHGQPEVVANFWYSYHWFREARIKKPSWNIIFADSNPAIYNSTTTDWGSTLWWPTINIYGEGVNDTRHLKGGNVVFNDGHAEYRRTGTINPRQDGTNEFIQFWDPMLRYKR